MSIYNRLRAYEIDRNYKGHKTLIVSFITLFLHWCWCYGVQRKKYGFCYATFGLTRITWKIYMFYLGAKHWVKCEYRWYFKGGK